MSELPLEISCQEVQLRLRADGGELLLVDCRELEEYNLVSIPEATLLPMSELPVRIAELDQHRQRHVVVHCHLGGRSLQVAAWLRRQGFPKAQSMAGGIDQWAVAIAPGMPRY